MTFLELYAKVIQAPSGIRWETFASRMVKMSSSTNAWTGLESVTTGFSIPWTARRSAAEQLASSGEPRIEVRFQPIQTAAGKQPLGYRAVADFCDSQARAIPFSQLMGWAKSQELQAILQSYRLQGVLQQAGPKLNGARLVLPVEAQLFYANQWSWLELVERAENCNVLTGQLVWELAESEAAANERVVRRFINEGREFFARFVLTVGATRTADWKLVQTLRPDFIQLPEQLVAGCAASQYRRDWIADTIGRAGESGIRTLACGVHTQIDWECLCSLGIAGGTGTWLGSAGPLPEIRQPLV